MGIVFQDFRLLPDKTVYENVAFAMYIVKATPRHIRRQVPMVLSLVGLSGKAKMYPNELSGGEQQRTSIGRALITNPAIILADEPTGNLDSKASEEIVELLKKSNKDYNQTIIMITHNPEIASRADRIIKIEDGHIVGSE